MTSLFILAAIASTAQTIPSAIAAEAPPAGEAPISLICAGTSAKDETVGDGLTLMLGGGHQERVNVEDSAGFRIAADNTGQARLPKRIQPAYKQGGRDGWFPLVNLRRSADEITGQIRFHSMYKPRFRLDRLTGGVTVTGDLGGFSGSCQPYDPATVERKF